MTLVWAGGAEALSLLIVYPKCTSRALTLFSIFVKPVSGTNSHAGSMLAGILFPYIVVLAISIHVSYFLKENSMTLASIPHKAKLG